MKINIDESTFNRAIHDNLMEIAKFLLDRACPTDYTSYLQIADISVLNWLYDNGVILSKKCLSEVISTTGDILIIKWFIDKGVVVDDKCLSKCISTNNYELLSYFVEKYDVLLTVENFIAAVSTQDETLLDYLKSRACPFNETVVEYAIKHSKKESIKWLVLNDFF
jgi:hypothetical protein